MTKYKDYWFSNESGLMKGENYSYDVQQNIITDKFRIVFKGAKNWNEHVKLVRYYANKPTDRNICLTIRTM